jgi:hypothetical protein
MRGPPRGVGPARAADTGLVCRLEAEWRAVVASRRFRTRLCRWGLEDPRLLRHGDERVAAARGRDYGDWHRRDQLLAALLDRVGTEPLARVALHAVVPGSVSWIDGVQRWDTEGHASRVVTEAVCLTTASQTDSIPHHHRIEPVHVNATPSPCQVDPQRDHRTRIRSRSRLRCHTRIRSRSRLRCHTPLQQVARCLHVDIGGREWA